MHQEIDLLFDTLGFCDNLSQLLVEYCGLLPVEVTSWSAVASWHFTWGNDFCAMCTNGLDFPCSQCQDANPLCIYEELICLPRWLACGHAYHQHCLDSWKNKYCPLDDEEIQFT